MAQPDWGKPQFASHTWLEPIIVMAIMVASCYFNRLPGYTIQPFHQGEGLLDQATLEPYDQRYLAEDDDQQTPLSPSSSTSTKHSRKRQYCCGIVFHTPNTSRYAHHWHSRCIQKFPFLVEMFYWALNFTFYAGVKALTEIIFANKGVWDTAQNHGIAVLTLEQDSPLSILFPLKEVDVQHYFIHRHQDLLTILNRMYSWVHIPATVSFLGWYYYAAPTHSQFAKVRRTMTLTNLLSFAIFTVFPCMPPRLLPQEYGFFDTVRQDDAQSVWASGKFFNQLAAFPSLHYGYAFCIGATLIYSSGVFRQRLAHREKRLTKMRQVLLVAVGVLYPCFVLTIVVATANHYWLDAMAAAFVVGLSWLCNRILLVLLPLEDLFLWCARLEKPVPTTGNRR